MMNIAFAAALSTEAIALIVIAAVLLLLFVIILYNSMVGRKNRVEQAFATIDVMLKKRYDLIPNLVDAVKTYMTHESETLVRITELRARAMESDTGGDEQLEINNQLSRLLRDLKIQIEDYPDLKASQNFMHLQESLNEIEAQLSAARRTFNAAVTEFNNAVEMFPTSIIASMMRYRRRQLLEAEEAEREKPDVGDLFKG